MNGRYCIALVLNLIALRTDAGTSAYSIDAHIVSAGTSRRASSNCYSLDAVVAEPIAGFSSGGNYGLSSGFLAIDNAATDSIFADHFEDCTHET